MLIIIYIGFCTNLSIFSEILYTLYIIVSIGIFNNERSIGVFKSNCLLRIIGYLLLIGNFLSVKRTHSPDKFIISSKGSAIIGFIFPGDVTTGGATGGAPVRGSFGFGFIFNLFNIL